MDNILALKEDGTGSIPDAVKAVSARLDRKTRVLRERAKALAREKKEAAPAGGTLDVVEFRIGEERYAIASTFVGEVFPLKRATLIPCTPSFVMGIVNLRGQILSLVDVRILFGLPGEISEKAMVIVLRTATADVSAAMRTENMSDAMELGIVVDALLGVRSLLVSEIHPPLPTLAGIRQTYLKGLWGEDLILLDAAKILSDKALVVDEDVPE